MGWRDKTIVLLAPPEAGRSTTIGCMLFKVGLKMPASYHSPLTIYQYGGIDLLTMQRFQQGGIQTYDQAARNLKALKITLTFDTPKHHVTISSMYAWAWGKSKLTSILDANTVQADCAIVVLSVHALTAENSSVVTSIFDNTSNAKQLIILINKMLTLILDAFQLILTMNQGYN